MSMNGIGAGQSCSVEPAVASRATSAAGAPAAADDAGDKSLQALQQVLTQIEGAANTRAIPAHQSW